MPKYTDLRDSTTPQHSQVNALLKKFIVIDSISCLILLQTSFSATNSLCLYSRFFGEELRYVMLSYVVYLFF